MQCRSNSSPRAKQPCACTSGPITPLSTITEDKTLTRVLLRTSSPETATWSQEATRSLYAPKRLSASSEEHARIAMSVSKTSATHIERTDRGTEDRAENGFEDEDEDGSGEGANAETEEEAPIFDFG